MPAKTISTLHRILEMLKVVPVYPRFIHSKDVCTHLNTIGAGVSKRTVERDLMALTEVVGLTFGDSPDGYKWSFSFDSSFQFIPALSAEEALSLKLVQQHLKLFLPSATFDKLNALFKKSDDILKRDPEVQSWPSLVQAMPPSFTPTPNEINQTTIDNVYAALMQKRVLHIKYANKPKTYKIKPLGVVIRDKKLVLVCKYDGFDNVRNVLVHRINDSELSNETFSDSINMNKYVDDQATAVTLSKEKIDVEFHAKGYVKQLLAESVFDVTQAIEELDETWSKATMSVMHTVELENWLLSQLQNIKIIGPSVLKERVIKKALDGVALNQ